MRGRSFACGWVLLVGACARVGAPIELALPDPARDGLEGRDGPYGAAAVTLDVQARVVEVLPTWVVYPADAELAPLAEEAAAVVFVHEAGVDPERYLWLAGHFATRGYVSVLPRATFLQPSSEPGDGEIALAALRAQAQVDGLLSGIVGQYGPVAAMGHGEGGRLATRQWLRDADLPLLVLLGASPAPADPVEEQADRSVLAVVGTEDPALAEVEAAITRFPGPRAAHVVDGMNHTAWTDDPTEGERAGDGALGRPLADVRLTAERVVDAYLDVYLIGGYSTLIEGPFPGTVP